jgi:hypothetical protein
MEVIDMREVLRGVVVAAMLAVAMDPMYGGHGRPARAAGGFRQMRVVAVRRVEA